ncbi:hypothetical protein ACFLZ6_00250 [Nanoarchaeota archaeon]
MRRRRNLVVLYFAEFYLLYFFYFARFCKVCWNIKYYNPHAAAFVLGVISTYIVFLILHEDILRVERYKRK